MKVTIISRKDAQNLMSSGLFPTNTAVISFYSPQKVKAGDYDPVDYSGFAERVYYACVPDIDIEALQTFGYTYNTYFHDVDKLTELFAVN